MRRNLSYYGLLALHTFNGVILQTHPVRGELDNERNATGEVATITIGVLFRPKNCKQPASSKVYVYNF